MKLPTLAPDKAQHVIYGLAVFIAASALLALAGGAQWHALLVVLFVGIAKEAADQRANWRAAQAGLAERHGVELGDVLATVAGGLAGCAAQLAPLASFFKHL